MNRQDREVLEISPPGFCWWRAAERDGWRYVVPGTGQLPLEEGIALLREAGYDGWIMFEHEKRWHPELEEPEEIFPKFVAWIRPLLGRYYEDFNQPLKDFGDRLLE